MGKGLLFFCCSCCILVLTIVNLSIGPIINHKTEMSGTMNCAQLQDNYDDAKKGTLTDEQKKYSYEWYINRCKNGKAMHDMEYTSFIFDIVIGFVCGLIGLLHLFDLKKDFVSNTGLIGLICGAIGFVLTFVYVILNGIVYTSYYEERIYKRDGDGVFAELEGNKYKCLYFDTKGNTHALIAKYSDLNKKQYNYNKDLLDSYDTDEVDDCIISSNYNYIPGYGNVETYGVSTLCGNEEYFSSSSVSNKHHDNSLCTKLYVDYSEDIGITNKDKSDRFLTTLILSLFVCLASIGLALFGFLLFRTPGDF